MTRLSRRRRHNFPQKCSPRCRKFPLDTNAPDKWVQTLLRPLAVAGVEPYASRLNAAPDEIVQMFEPQEINIAVTGGEAQGAWKMFGARCERTVSIDAWR